MQALKELSVVHKKILLHKNGKRHPDTELGSQNFNGKSVPLILVIFWVSVMMVLKVM